MNKHVLHHTYRFVGRRKGYGKAGDKLVWESRATTFWGVPMISEITVDATWFYEGMQACGASTAPSAAMA